MQSRYRVLREPMHSAGTAQRAGIVTQLALKLAAGNLNFYKPASEIEIEKNKNMQGMFAVA